MEIPKTKKDQWQSRLRNCQAPRKRRTQADQTTWPRRQAVWLARSMRCTQFNHTSLVRNLRTQCRCRFAGQQG